MKAVWGTNKVDIVNRVDKILLLQPGSLSIERGEQPGGATARVKKDMGVAGESSVVLIESNGRVVLIDTGFRNEMDMSSKNLELNNRHVEASLSVHGYSTKDVEEIFITHWHHDHVGNAILFPLARLRYGSSPAMAPPMLSGFLGIKNPLERLEPRTEWVPGVSVFPTPGHNEHHHSALVHYKQTVIVVAGDAIVSQSYYDHDAVWPYNGDFYSEAKAIESMREISRVADLIIPGHGHPFQSYKKATRRRELPDEADETACR
ncbi:MAG: MBL fold metallo-hydrolase [Candidatus Lokiarchaeota archaeon]|nr:MBL fold metallo-hydrolase [Candidatus Lokiarchaeota archaeon]